MNDCHLIDNKLVVLTTSEEQDFIESCKKSEMKPFWNESFTIRLRFLNKKGELELTIRPTPEMFDFECLVLGNSRGYVEVDIPGRIKKNLKKEWEKFSEKSRILSSTKIQ